MSVLIQLDNATNLPSFIQLSFQENALGYLSQPDNNPSVYSYPLVFRLIAVTKIKEINTRLPIVVDVMTS
jgi:hypothetical protein